MKNYILYILFIGLISCQTKEKETEPYNEFSKSKYRSFSQDIEWNSGFFFKKGYPYIGSDETAFFLNICEYIDSFEIPLVSEQEIDFLKKKLYISDMYTITPITEKYTNYYKAYYEITSTRDWHNTKITGKLYLLGHSSLLPGRGGAVFMSDTTEQYGWFIVLCPIAGGVAGEGESHPKYQHHPDSLIYYTRIKSLHPKAQELCGNYERLSWNPYRLIKDEEVE